MTLNTFRLLPWMMVIGLTRLLAGTPAQIPPLPSSTAPITFNALPPAGRITVSVSPTNVTFKTGTAFHFTPTITNTYSADLGLNWYVNGVLNGDSTNGLMHYGNYNAPASIPPINPIQITVASTVDPRASATAWVTLTNAILTPPPGSITVSISPTNTSLPTGAAFHFNSTITNTFSSDIGVNWYVNGVLNGDSTNGLIRFGNFNAPTNVPLVNPVKVTMASTVNTNVTASAWVTITNPIYAPPPGSITVSISPTNTSLPTGAAFHFNSTITNTFSSDIGVNWYVNGVLNGDSTNGLIRFGNFNAPTNVPPVNPVKVTMASTLDTNVTASAWVTITNPIYTPPPGSIKVTISPTNTSLATGAAFHFDSTITNTFSSDIGVNWYVNGVLNGDSTNGLIRFGNFNAPTNVPPVNPVKVTVASTLDTNVTASAWVTITNPIYTPPPGSIKVTISPTNTSLATGAAFHFDSTITNTFSSDIGVNWYVNGVLNGDSTNGLIRFGNFNAPTNVPPVNPVKVTVASTLDTNVTASAWVTITNPIYTPPPGSIKVTISPTNTSLATGAAFHFDSTITNTFSSDIGVNWYVNGVLNGDSTNGLIRFGNFNAPTNVPPVNPVKVTVASTLDTNVTASAWVTITNPIYTPPPGSIKVTISPTNTSLATGAAFHFDSTITNTFSSDIGVNWYVNGVLNGDSTNGLIRFGNFNAPTNVPPVNPVKVTVASTLDTNVTASAWVTITNPIYTPPPGSITLSISPTNVSFATGTNFQFTSTLNNTFSSDIGINWYVNGVLNGDSTNGLILLGKYSAPTNLPPTNVVVVTATSTADPTVNATAWITLTNPIYTPPPGSITLSISPTNVSFATGTNFQFTSTLNNTFSSDIGINWYVNGVLNGDSTNGLISLGTYSAPTNLPPTNVVVVTAASTADPTVKATAWVTLTNPIYTPPPGSITLSISPTNVSFATGTNFQFTSTLNNTFSSDIGINWYVNGVLNGDSTNGLILLGKYSAPTNLPPTNVVVVTATSTADPTVNATAWITLTNPIYTPPPGSITLSISPTNVSFATGTNFQFTSTLNNTFSSDIGINWYVNGVLNGDSTNGLILLGKYSAPTNLPPTNVVVVTAASTADPTVKATAWVTLTNPIYTPPPGSITLSISPTNVSFATGTNFQFTSTLNNTFSSDVGINWYVNGVLNGDSTNGLILLGKYSAPTNLPPTNVVVVTATSTADPTVNATAWITLTNPIYTPPPGSITLSISPTNVSFATGTNFQFTSTLNNTFSSDVGINWYVNGVLNGDSTNGLISLGTYSAPTNLPPTNVVVVTAASTADPTVKATAWITLTNPIYTPPPGSITLSISPTNVSFATGTNFQFTSTLNNTFSSDVGINWYVNGVLNGDSTNGLILLGKYSAPTNLPPTNVVVVTAASTADPTVNATAWITLTNPIYTPPPGSITLSISPTNVSFATGTNFQFTSTLNNTFSSDIGINWYVNGVLNGDSTNGLILLGKYSAPTNLPPTNVVVVTATSTADPTVNATAWITLTNPIYTPPPGSITLSISPTNVSFATGTNFQFTSTLNNTFSSDIGINWYVNGVLNGDSTNGLILLGKYSAPTNLPPTNVVVVTATSTADPTVNATAWITLTNPIYTPPPGSITLSISPTNVSFATGTNFQFTSTLNNTFSSDVGINWYVNGVLNGDSTNGLILLGKYSAPTNLPPTNVVVVTATSTADPTVNATAWITLTNPIYTPPPGSITLSISPTNVSFATGTNFQFTSTLNNTFSSDVGINWYVNGVLNGDSTNGLISLGTYSAPTNLPPTNVVVVTAASTADPTVKATAWITLTNPIYTPPPGSITLSISPTNVSFATGTNFQFTSTLNNTFSSDVGINWYVNGVLNGDSTNGLILLGKYSAPTNLPPTNVVVVTAASTADPTVKATAWITLTNPIYTPPPGSITLSISPTNVSFATGTNFQFTSTLNNTFSSDVGINWYVNGVLNGDSTNGLILLGKYSAPTNLPPTNVVVVTAASTADPTVKATAWITLTNPIYTPPPGSITLSISPTNVSFATGTNFQFTSTLNNTFSSDVGINWYVNGVLNGDSTNGLISLGTYSAPTNLPPTNVVVVTAASTADPTVKATAWITLTNPIYTPPPGSITLSISPTNVSFATGTNFQFTSTLNNTFSSDVGINWYVNGVLNGDSTNGLISLGTYSAPTNLPPTNVVVVTAASTADPTVKATAWITLTNPIYTPPPGSITLSISPTNVSFATGTNFQFTSTLNNTFSSDVGINWYVNGVLNGDSTNGLILLGKYSAPTNLPPTNVVVVTAASTADPTVKATAWITLTNPIYTPPPGSITLSISPTNVSFATGTNFQFTSTLNNTFSSDVGINWYVNGVLNGDSTNGLILLGKYSAPTNLPPTNVVVVTAASTADPTVNATAWITLTNPIYTPPPGSITLSISPTNVSFATGTNFQFTSTLNNTFSSDVGINWYVNGVLNGDSTNGLISLGTYSAPTNLPPTNVVVVTAASTADPTVKATAWITLTNPIYTPPPGSIVLSVTPTNVSFVTGTAFHFTSTITNSFNRITDVQWSVNGVVDGDTTNGLIHFGNYNAPSKIPPINPIKIQVASTVDPTVVATAWVTLTNPILTPPPGSIVLSVTPTNVSFLPGTAFHFTSTITNTFNQITDVKWSVNGVVDGDTTNGLIHFGNYNAPSTIPPINPIKIQVASTVDPTVIATAWVTLTNLPPPPRLPITLTLSPTNSTIKLGGSVQYSRVLVNTTNWGVTWTVNGIPGGNTNVGTVVSNLYTSPVLMPPSPLITLVATSQADPTVSATAIVNLQFPYPAISSVSPNPIPFGNQTVILTGTWFDPQTVIKDAYGKVQTSTWLSPTQISVTANFPPTLSRYTSFQAANPNPYLTLSPWFNAPTTSAGTNMSFLAAGRILEQASWGPNSASVDHLQSVGFGTWWNEQLAAVPSTYFHDTNYPYDLSAIQIQFVSNALTGMDQLRQRVAFALSGFLVVSGVKEGSGDKFAPYYNVLSKDALGSYKQLITDITLCPSMGMYLDMADNDLGNFYTGSVPNENFARELMQLFTVGPVALNPDGTFPVDSKGAQIPLYNQAVVSQMARVFTGWTYAGTPDLLTGHCPKNFTGVMQAVEWNHDIGSKTILGGVVLPAGQTARQDLDATINLLVNHTNCAPFVSFRLIQHLVTGNPTPAYVQRVATVFRQTQGDLSAVVLAILTDAEARQGDNPLYVPSTNFGHLREPVLFTLSSLRALGAQPPPGWLVARWTAKMGQNLFYPPSVFGYYYPYYLTDAGLVDPEFQTLSQPGSLYRLNFINNLVTTGMNGYANVPFNNYIPLASNSNTSIQAIANQFFYGKLPSDLSSIIQTTFAGGPTVAASVYNSIYLALTSSYYQVQH